MWPWPTDAVSASKSAEMEQTPDGNADMDDDEKRLRKAPGLGIMRPLMTSGTEQCGKRRATARLWTGSLRDSWPGPGEKCSRYRLGRYFGNYSVEVDGG
jgi:hypothetical protein